MGTVKQIQVPEDLFQKIETLRRKRRVSRIELLRQLLDYELELEEAREELKAEGKLDEPLSEEEAMALANEAVAWARDKLRRSRK